MNKMAILVEMVVVDVVGGVVLVVPLKSTGYWEMRALMDPWTSISPPLLTRPK